MKFIKCIKSSAFQTSGNWYELLSDINTKQLKIKAIWGGRIYIVNSIRFDLTDIRNEIAVPKQEEYKMKEFQNEQHKQLHNALIGAGFTECDGDKSQNETIRWWGNGYINEPLDECVFFDECVDGDVGIRNISNGKVVALSDASVADIITYCESLAPTQPITKDNIIKTLEYNGWFGSSLQKESIRIKDGGSNDMGVVFFFHPKWIESIELLVGKLKRLPKLEND